jgi:hypothetical protein
LTLIASGSPSRKGTLNATLAAITLAAQASRKRKRRLVFAFRVTPGLVVTPTARAYGITLDPPIPISTT